MFLLEVPIHVVKFQRMIAAKNFQNLFVVSGVVLLFCNELANTASIERFTYRFETNSSHNYEHYDGKNEPSSSSKKSVIIVPLTLVSSSNRNVQAREYEHASSDKATEYRMRSKLNPFLQRRNGFQVILFSPVLNETTQRFETASLTTANDPETTTKDLKSKEQAFIDNATNFELAVTVTDPETVSNDLTTKDDFGDNVSNFDRTATATKPEYVTDDLTTREDVPGENATNFNVTVTSVDLEAVTNGVTAKKGVFGNSTTNSESTATAADRKIVANNLTTREDTVGDNATNFERSATDIDLITSSDKITEMPDYEELLSFSDNSTNTVPLNITFYDDYKAADQLDGNSDNKTENMSLDLNRKKIVGNARQFVFHPYLPYEKEVAPDEKISFHDILPVKMVKFVKSMVEEAPWEQMFMKMVRMIVDQFVDKIIEKMFEHKEEDHEKWRSFDVLYTPPWIFPTFSTPVVRLRRSVKIKQNDGDITSLLAVNRVLKDEMINAQTSNGKTWLDQILDYLFPEENTDNSIFHSLKRRDVTINTKLVKYFVSLIGKTIDDYLQMFNNASDLIADRGQKYQRMHNILLEFHKRNQDLSNTNSIYATPEMTSISSSDFFSRLLKILQKHPTYVANIWNDGTIKRAKRSIDDSVQREDEQRLWQASGKDRRRSQMARDECSLRKACNAGRLLSRLPSVQEIMLQLRSYGNEPHWDALLWGMKKKRCSKVFCKRRRSPKGSRRYWNSPDHRPQQTTLNDAPAPEYADPVTL